MVSSFSMSSACFSRKASTSVDIFRAYNGMNNQSSRPGSIKTSIPDPEKNWRKDGQKSILINDRKTTHSIKSFSLTSPSSGRASELDSSPTGAPPLPVNCILRRMLSN
ncbi:hypothetical protein PM082_013739 [Marasmius tenuissimus]|nr:hypothetical protein PM082_013739 [Marasmius tenuissimus]